MWMRGLIVGLLAISIWSCGDEAPAEIQNANNGLNNGANNGANNGTDPCSGTGDSLEVVAPVQGEVVGPGGDTDPGEDGVQIAVEVEVTGQVDVVTVHNVATGFSHGGVPPVISGVTLVEGDNPLEIFAPDPCVERQSIVVQLRGPQTCEANTDCPEGQLCEGGVCGVCDALCGEDACGECDNGCCVGPARQYRYVLVEDLTSPVSGSSPGADIDAISVRVDGQEHFATSLEDSVIAQEGNNFADPNALLGPSDSNCEVMNFTALGGRGAGGYAIVGFGTQRMGNGDVVKVYEVGSTLCGRFDDDPFRVSVGVSDMLGSFVSIGESRPGQIEFTLQELD